MTLGAPDPSPRSYPTRSAPCTLRPEPSLLEVGRPAANLVEVLAVDGGGPGVTKRLLAGALSWLPTVESAWCQVMRPCRISKVAGRSSSRGAPFRCTRCSGDGRPEERAPHDVPRAATEPYLLVDGSAPFDPMNAPDGAVASSEVAR